MKQVIQSTPSYKAGERRKVIDANHKNVVRHAYYHEYRALQQLCILILRNEQHQYGNGTRKVYGILFDGAWLWEEYLWTILKDAKFGDKNFEHPTNKDRKGGIRLFDNSLDPEDSSFKKCYRRIYPDFYCENSREDSNDGIILDAKYKRLENGLVRDDLYQIISYMHTMKIPTGGFVYPQKEKEELVEQKPTKYLLANDTGIIKTFGFVIPQNAREYTSFCKEMQKYELSLLSQFSKI